MTSLSPHGDFVFSRYRLEQPYVSDHLDGADRHYLIIVRKGCGSYDIGGNTLDVSEGDAVFIPRYTSYLSIWEGDPETVLDSFGFLSSPEPLPGILCRVTPKEAVYPLCDDVLRGGEVNCLSASAFYTLLGSVLPLFNKVEVKGPMQIRSETMVADVARFVLEYPKCSAGDMAKTAGMSESVFFGKFKAASGLSPIAFKHRVLTDEAARLSETSTMTVDEIRKKLGFCSVSYFRHVLKNVTGKHPEELRKNMRI